jgi:DNA-binding NtrC family response regulator
MKLSTSQAFKDNRTKPLSGLGGNKDISVNLNNSIYKQDIAEEVKKENFREDLYYRLKVIPIHLPALRDRVGDIPLLAKFFIDDFNREFKKDVKGLSKETEKAFLNYPWPGNVRELKNVIERAMILENEEYILPEHLPAEFSLGEVRLTNMMNAPIILPQGGFDIEEVEKNIIKQALEQTKWNQTRAAKLLNLSRDALRYRMQKFGFLQEKNKF